MSRLWPLRILLHMTWVLIHLVIELGTVGPVIIKLALERVAHTEQFISSLYACNAVEGITGTFLTGFLSDGKGRQCADHSQHAAGAFLGLDFPSTFLLAVLPGQGIVGVASRRMLPAGPTEPNTVCCAEPQD